ncbi:MAG: hypothetical protein WCF24_08570 [Acidimicrobiales bacterium]
MTETVTDEQPLVSRRRWLWDHAGRLGGIVLGLFAVAFLAILAIAGYTPAALFIPVVLAGLVLIVLGGRIHAG